MMTRSSRVSHLTTFMFAIILSSLCTTCYQAEGTIIVLPPSPPPPPSSSAAAASPAYSSTIAEKKEKKNVFSSRAAGFGMEFRKGVRYVAELMEPTNGDIYLCGDNDSDGSGNGNVVDDDDDVRGDYEANDKERIVHATALSGVGGGGIPGGCGLFAFCGTASPNTRYLFHTALYYSRTGILIPYSLPHLSFSFSPSYIAPIPHTSPNHS
jgi:hypothetical protein